MGEKDEIDIKIGITGSRRWPRIETFLKKHLEETNGYTILDVGGTKYSYNSLQQLFPKSKIIALNICKDDIAGIEDSILGDAQELSAYINRESIDIIIATDIIEHLVDPDAFLDGCEYCLKKRGGVLTITTPNLATIYNRILLLLGYSLPNYNASIRYRVGVPFTCLRTPTNHKSVFTFQELEKLLRLHNFEIVQSSGFTYAGQAMWNQGERGRGELFRPRLFIDKLLPKRWKEGMLIVSKLVK